MAREVRTGADFDEESFQSWYGPIRGLGPAEVGNVFAGSGVRWAIAGGRAARVGASATRHHEDTDVEVPLTELPMLRRHLAAWHLWQASDGWLRPLLADDPLREGVNQLWLRRDAHSPWVLDILLVPGTGEEWVYRRNPDVRLPWSRAHWKVAGATYVRPEIALLFKAKQDRPKDRADLEVAHLTVDGRSWLIEQLRAEGREAWTELAARETRWRDLRW